MAAEYRITVPIDPTGTKTGAAAVKQELTGIATAATQVGNTIQEAVGGTKATAGFDAVTAAATKTTAAINKEADANATLAKSTTATTDTINKSATAHDNLAKKSGGANSAQLLLQGTIRHTTDQIAAGAPVATIFAEHIAAVAEYAELAGGSLGKFGEFMAGPFGIAIGLAAAALGILAQHFVGDQKAAEEAKKAQEEFAKTTSSIQSVIDQTTGKLRKQAEAYALIARNAAIADQAKKQKAASDSSDQAFNLVRSVGQRGPSGFAAAALASEGVDPAQLSDPDVARIANQSKNVSQLTVGLDALARRRPDLKALADQVRGVAQTALQFDADQKKDNDTIASYNILLSHGILLSKDLADANAQEAASSTGLTKAQAALNAIKKQGAEIDKLPQGPDKQRQLQQYQAAETEAIKAVNAERSAQTDLRKELSEATKERKAAEKAILDFNKAVNATTGEISKQAVTQDKTLGNQIKSTAGSEYKTNQAARDRQFETQEANNNPRTIQQNQRADDQRLGFTDDSAIKDQIDQIEEQRNKDLEAQQKYRDAGLIIEEDYQKRVREINAKAQSDEEEVQNKRRDVALTAADDIGTKVTDIAATAFGKQSAIYKATFAMEKAVAIARSVVAIQTGIALAAADPFPKNLVDIASVVAATASIIANIQSVALNFADGGIVRGPGGPRSDSIKANLSDGEYVVPANAVQRGGNLALLEAMRSGTVTAGLRAANNNAATVSSTGGGGDTYAFSFGDINVSGAQTAADGKSVANDVKASIADVVDDRIRAAKRPGGSLRTTRPSVLV